MNINEKIGKLYVTKKDTGVMLGSPHDTVETLYSVPYNIISMNNIALLLEIVNLTDINAYIWLLDTTVVWQILYEKDFVACWSRV